MKSTISRTSKALGVLALTLTMTTNLARAQSAYPPLSLLAAQWWQWALAEPASTNPVLDTSGAFAALNQRGRVWFLAGNFGGTTVRNITVPAGKALFFPLVNIVDFEDGIAIRDVLLPGGAKVFCLEGSSVNCPLDHQPVQVEQAIVSSIIATATGLSCKVDVTHDCTANLEQSTPFSVLLPADNILGQPAGVYFPAVDSGYYVLLAPLSSGSHTIHFTGGFTSGFSLDVTYNITVL